MNKEQAGPENQDQMTPDKNFYDRNAVNNVLQQLENNRRITPGFNNFLDNYKMPEGGNPYPKSSLAGKFMDPMRDSMKQGEGMPMDEEDPMMSMEEDEQEM